MVAAFLLSASGLGRLSPSRLGGEPLSRRSLLIITTASSGLLIGLFGLVSLQIFDWVGLRFGSQAVAQTGIVAFAPGVVLPTLLAGRDRCTDPGRLPEIAAARPRRRWQSSDSLFGQHVCGSRVQPAISRRVS